MTAQDLENGNENKGLTGALGDGQGKWRLTVNSTLPLEVISLIRTTDGFLTNLGGMVEEDTDGDHVIYFANPASEPSQQTFLRIVNTSDVMGNVSINAVDDEGEIAPGGEVTFSLAAQAAKQMTGQDLENGNETKGLIGMLGDGTGRWRLTVSADVDLQVMSLVRTPDGFLTNLSRVAPVTGDTTDVYIFNPGSNSNQVSSLRIVNTEDAQAAVTINGIDDAGEAAPGGVVTFNIPAAQVLEISAEDLEIGNADITGALGDGAGKWHLQITSTTVLKVQSLMSTPTGFLTNLSNPAN